MSVLLTLLILFLVLAAVLVGVVRVVSRLAGQSTPNISNTPPFAALPYSKTNFLSAAERSFYEILKRLVPADHVVFAKVRLADLVCVSKGAGAWQSHFNRISRKHIDFVLCNRDLAPVVAIELDDSSHDEEERGERDEFVDGVMAAAALPLVHIKAQRGYALDKVRAALHSFLPARAPGEVPPPDERYMPPRGWRPAV